MFICFNLLPKLDPPAVPVRYLYNLCSHTSSLLIPDPMSGRLGFSLWRRNLPPLFIPQLLSVLQLTRVTLLQVYIASRCLPRLDSVLLISCHFSISIYILSDQLLNTLVFVKCLPPKICSSVRRVSPRQPDPLRRCFRGRCCTSAPQFGTLMVFCGSHRAPFGSH